MAETLICITILSLSILVFEISRCSRVKSQSDKLIENELERPDLITLIESKK